MNFRKPYFLETNELEREYTTNISNGLSTLDVNKLTEKYGSNSLPKDKKISLLSLILEQFEDNLVRILLLAALISALLGFTDPNVDHIDAVIEPVVILTVLILNAVISIKQTKNAEEAIEALKEYEPELAKVYRDGNVQVQWIKSSELVPGDVVEVCVGDRVPADIRIVKINSSSLKVDQSILTGESMSVLKMSEKLENKSGYKIVNQDKINMLFSGTNIVAGKCLGIVTGTGKETEIGNIWHQLNQQETIKTPLQQKLDEFGNQLSKIITLICILVWVINFNHFCDPIHGGSWIKGAVYYFKIAISLAVAAIPEGLPAVITTCLSIGTKKMAKKNAIVRSLPSVETLGCTTVICSDKTGTLTTNQMSIIKAFVVSNDKNNNMVELEATGTSYDPRDGQVLVKKNKNDQISSLPILEQVADICIMCNDASLHYNTNKDQVERVGEATEAAMLTFSEKLNPFNLDRSRDIFYGTKNFVYKRFTKLNTLEFSRDRKSMSVVVYDNQEKCKKLFAKGASENIINRCKYVRIGTETIELNDELKKKLLEHVLEYATGKDPLRCLALAMKDHQEEITADQLKDSTKFDELESDMIFIGVVGMIDPPRTQVSKAIQDCKNAGIRVIVITGDNKETAISICKRIGIFKDDEPTEGIAYSSAEFDALSLKEQKDACMRARLFARVEPAHKTKIVTFLQEAGEITAMTGDGVNDAPALKKAEIGIAMGSGTAVAKSASDLILADDNFSTIVEAVKEGRSIYRNAVQFISYLVSSNIGEVISIFITSMMGLPEGLIPVQLLWVNLITDGLPATALGFNPTDNDIMNQPPRRYSDSIIGFWQMVRYLIIGSYVGIATVLASVWWYLYDPNGPHLTFKHLIYHQSCSAVNPFYKGVDCELFNNYYPMTMALSVLVLSEMFNSYNCVSEFQSIFVVPPWKNMFLMVATCVSMCIHIFTTYFPFTQRIFQITALTLEQWQIVFILSIPVVIIDEFLKFILRYKNNSRQVKMKKE